ncbi:MAG: phage tail protein [Bacteroidales bacterium]
MDAFIGEIRLMAIGYTPQYWTPCDGRQLQVMQYQALYSLIGNKWGGTANQTFNLPDLRGRVVVGVGDDPVDVFDPTWGSKGGDASVAINVNQVPSHSHTFVGATTGQALLLANGENCYLSYPALSGIGSIENSKPFSTLPATGPVTMNANTLAPFTGGTAAHENRQPYLALGYFICTTDGVYPMRN